MTPLCASLKRHRWQRSTRIGCRENPGVMDTGNGAIVTVDVCARCGMERAIVRSYCGRTRDNRIQFRWPSGDPVET